jgi:glucosamine 6-phosphate synthetase-like amidotransferase/phosphosugar isomerase protein
MCGICGYNGNQSSLDFILNTLEKLEAYVGGKGIDIAFRLDNRVRILKCKGKLQDFMERFSQDEDFIKIKNNGCLGIAHTRHPSSGFFLNEDRFSHPLYDCSKTLALVHNGSLNSSKLHLAYKQLFNGHNFATKKEGKILDSELLIHMVEHFHAEGNSLLDAIKRTFSIAEAYRKLKGFGMFAVISNEDDNIYIAYGPHDENSLEIRKNENGFYFYTVNAQLKKEMVEPKNAVPNWNPYNRNQIIVIQKDGVEFHNLA